VRKPRRCSRPRGRGTWAAASSRPEAPAGTPGDRRRGHCAAAESGSLPTCSSGQRGGRNCATARGGAAAPAAGRGAARPRYRRAPPADGHRAGRSRSGCSTVVKSGPIQQTRAEPGQGARLAAPARRRVRVVLVVTASMLVFSASRAPLLSGRLQQDAEPSKAPWYFLAQELLTMFHPMVAGVTIPGMGRRAARLRPFSTRTRRASRRTARSRCALHACSYDAWARVIIGSFFGAGFNFVSRGTTASSSTCSVVIGDRVHRCRSSSSSGAAACARRGATASPASTGG
jgi:hypothetical protein